MNSYGRMSPDAPWIWLSSATGQSLTYPSYNDGRWLEFYKGDTPPGPTWGQTHMGWE
jgi:hypothetical protein